MTEYELKEKLIHKLQDEIIFLQQNKINLEFYRYYIDGDLSESRSC